MSAERPVADAEYDERYFIESCGGAEFFARYGAKIVKPVLAHALARAGLKQGQSALDVGCGRGELLYQLQQRGVRAAGIDFAQASTRLARKVSQSSVQRADAKKLPFLDKSFDRIFFLGVIDHLHDWELESCFAEFTRVLKPGGFLLANTCVNRDYYKNKSYALRARLSRALGLAPPSPPRSDEDEKLHVNEHDEGGLSRFFQKVGWSAEIEFRPNERYELRRLYGEKRPRDFPMEEPKPWKRLWHALSFAGPWKRYLARELFCIASPKGEKS